MSIATRIRVQRRKRTWDRSASDHRIESLGKDGWLSRAGDTVTVDVPDGRVTFKWDTQATNGELIYASLTYQPVRRGLLRPTRRKA